MNWRDAAAVFCFVAVFIASCLAEYYCGTSSQHCPIDWRPLYGADAQYEPGHCGTASHDSGLGDPALSVSSFFVSVALIYFKLGGPIFTPLVTCFLGIASFLFHCANTEITHQLDYIGIISFGPSILSDLLLWIKYKKLGFLFFCIVITTNFLLTFLVGKFALFIYISQPTYTVIILSIAWYFEKIKKIWLGALFLIGGSATLIAANNIDEFWGCIDTQLIEPHFWGHLIIGIGATLYCRTIFRDDGYTQIKTNLI